MTLTIELTTEQEARLLEKARAIGLEPAAYLIRTIEASEPKPGLLPGETLLDAARRAGAVGAVIGTPRADGRQWSEIEGYEFE